MSKPSRRARPGSRPTGAGPSGPSEPRAGTTAAPATTTGSGRTSVRPAGTRAGRRERSRPLAEKPFFERYRVAIIGVVVVAAIGLMAVWAFTSASASAYTCAVEWVAVPTRAPDTGESPPPGYVQEDMGASHIGPGTGESAAVNYLYCPPASGPHFERGGPIQPRMYNLGERVIPQGWIHNLEHGGLVVLYRGDPGDAGTTETIQQQMRDFYANLPLSPVCGRPPGAEGSGVTIAQFDEMATPFAALVWGRVLPLQTFDAAAIMDFWTVNGEQLTTMPERLGCPAPTEPGASPSPS